MVSRVVFVQNTSAKAGAAQGGYCRQATKDAVYGGSGHYLRTSSSISSPCCTSRTFFVTPAGSPQPVSFCCCSATASSKACCRASTLALAASYSREIPCKQIADKRSQFSCSYVVSHRRAF